MVYRFEGKPHYATLGTYPVMSVAQAHEAHLRGRPRDPGSLSLRSGQGSRPARVDWNVAVWTIPGEIAKNHKAHTVPLTPLAMDLLEQAQEQAADSPWVFPGPRHEGTAPMGGTAIDHALLKALPALGLADVTPHDLRRTAASHMTALGLPRLVVSKILNHVERGVMTVYDRHSYDPEKRDALVKWVRKLRALLVTDNVIRLRA